MFKPQIVRRGFSLWARVPRTRIVNTAAHAGHETIHIQRVRIKRPLISRSRRFGLVLIPAGVYGFLRWLDEEEDDDDDDDEEETWQQQGDEDKDDDKDEALLFLPTGPSGPDPRTQFTEDDPEYQQQLLFRDDPQRRSQILGRLTQLILPVVLKLPSVQRTGAKAHLLWVSTAWEFPDGPPRTYSRPGVEYTDEGIWQRATRPVEAHHHHILDNAAYPVGTANALYVHAKEQVVILWKELNSYNPWRSKEPDVPITKDGSSSLPMPPSAKTTAHVQETPAAPPAVETPVTISSSTIGTDPRQQAAHPLGDHPLARYFPHISLEKVTIDLRDLRKNSLKGFKKRLISVPADAVVIKATARVSGENSSVPFSVLAIYDLKTDRILKCLLQQGKTISHPRTPPKASP